MNTKILKSLILVIGENATILKTPLMERTNLNYPRLHLYLNWLELVGFAKVEEQKVTLTETGYQFRARCLKLIES